MNIGTNIFPSRRYLCRTLYKVYSGQTFKTVNELARLTNSSAADGLDDVQKLVISVVVTQPIDAIHYVIAHRALDAVCAITRRTPSGQFADAILADGVVAWKGLHLAVVLHHTDSAGCQSIGGIRYQLADVIGRYAVLCDVAVDVCARATLTFPCKIQFSIVLRRRQIANHVLCDNVYTMPQQIFSICLHMPAPDWTRTVL